MNSNERIPLKYTFEASGVLDGPLVILVHGRANRLGVMSIFKRSLPCESNILSVEAPWPDPDGGFSWWDIRNAAEGESVIIARARMLLDTVEKVIANNNLMPSGKIGIGFSQGGAILSVGIQLDPVAFDAVAMLCSFLKQVATPDSDSERQPNASTRIFICHGRSDEIVPFSRSEESASKLKMLGHEVTFVAEEGGHKVGIEGGRALKNWLATISTNLKGR